MLSTPPAIINCASPHFFRQTREQQAHARDVAVVFAGLVGAAVKHVGDRSPIDFGVARHQRAQRNRAEIVGAHRGERAAVAAEGRAHGIADEGLVHARCLR
jgi:hypothetical protein